MKRILLLPLIAAMAMIISCDEESNNNPPNLPDALTSYEGTLSIDTTATEITCDIIFNEAYSACDITINNMKFAPAMPPVNIKMASVPCSIGEEALHIMGDSIIPIIEMNGVTMPGTAYVVKNFNGEIKDSDFRFSAAIGTMGVFTFNGNKLTDDSVEFPEVTPSDSIDSPVVAPSDSLVDAGTVERPYIGTLYVTALDSTSFVCQDVVTVLLITPANGSCDIYIEGAKFAEGMPVTVNILLEDIKLEISDSTYTFLETEVITPKVEMPGGEYVAMSEYNFSYLSGTISSDKTTFSAEMTKGSFYYSGK